MKVVYNGAFEKKSSGCRCKGKKSEYSFSTIKDFNLPSGAHKTFRVGEPAEVSDRDGAFLLKYSYVDVNGFKREVFSEVE